MSEAVNPEYVESYRSAQRALAELKAAVIRLLVAGPREGLKNSQIGRALGIYGGHRGHEGHISRTILARLEDEGLVRQDGQSLRWSLTEIPSPSLDYSAADAEEA
jgi:hypothetical protein